ncbi:uncharacterized protein LOC107368207 [Tetranychus urticae]|uniref:uncharacterized protein LOC107368207 n=1 Tax=Tetranychus urticae TaxID=32264 RepID=UPI00077B8840|nr:uncharacterized protein LOC107368207 [Tetranychus urticae]
MNNDNDCNKTIIRVQVSDAHQDIILDWSKDWYDIKRDTFRQLAEFTGISLKSAYDISFWKPPVTNDVYPENPFAFRADGRAWFRITNSYPSPEDIPRSGLRCTKQDFKDKFFRDGDCFALNTKMKMEVTLDELYVSYRLVHLDLIDKTECNRLFCHHMSNKAFLDKQAKITNPNIESYLRAQYRPVPRIEYGDINFNYDFHNAKDIREREIHADLNIGQYFYSYCTAFLNATTNQRTPRIYWPNRG